MDLKFRGDNDLEMQVEKYKNRVIELEAISKSHQASNGKLIEENKKLKQTIKKLQELVKDLVQHP